MIITVIVVVIGHWPRFK